MNMATTSEHFQEEDLDSLFIPRYHDFDSSELPYQQTDTPQNELVLKSFGFATTPMHEQNEAVIGTPDSSSQLFVSENAPEHALEDPPFVEPTETAPCGTESIAAIPQRVVPKTMNATELRELMLLKQRQNLARFGQTRTLSQPATTVMNSKVTCSMERSMPEPLDTQQKNFKRVKEIYTEKKWNKTLTEEEERDFFARELLELERAKKGRKPKAKTHLIPGLGIEESSQRGSPSLLSYQELHPGQTNDEEKRRLDADGDEPWAPKPRKRAKVTANRTSLASSRRKKKHVVDGGSGSMTLQKLFSNDVFQEAASTAHLGAQPLFGAHKHRAGVWKEILATVPEKDRPSAREDQMELDRAIAYINGNENGTGRQSVKAASDGTGLWMLKGIRTPLKAYQIMGVSRMRQRENSKEEPRGGLLCDAMGLGKTIQCLANIINGKPKPGADVKATLVIASPALIAQWEVEINTHCDGNNMGTWMAYHGRNRLKGNSVEGTLSTTSIVLTTYYEVSKSYPKAAYPPGLVTAQEKNEWWRRHFEVTRGPLHRVKWHRICLDEAACIKNHQSHISNACRALMYDHAWAITGTPVMNNLGEFYSLLKFVKCPNATTYQLFKDNFDSEMDVDGMRKLCYFLDEVMIRRTHADTLFNARLLDLPQPQEKTVWIQFNPLERKIYSIVQERMIEKINSIAAHENVDAEKSNSHVWTLILRLRQMCSHVLLIQDAIGDVLDRSDYERLNALCRRRNGIGSAGKTLLKHLAEVMANSLNEQEADATDEQAAIEASESYQESRSDPKHKESLRRLARVQRAVEKKRHALCVYCNKVPEDPYITSCEHIYCSSCLNALQHFTARSARDSLSCVKCNEVYTYAQALQERFDEEQEQANAEGVINRLQKGQADKQRVEGTKHWISTLEGEVLYSAKAKAAKDQIATWLEEEPSCKIIVYTQFLDIIRIMGRICDAENWEYVRYTGEMTHDARSKAIARFADEPTTCVFLASLKCGGIGLNLTMASRVLTLDPWFNLAIENQAFCRVFRIGQKKHTRMTRLVVQDSIDSAMHALKERKQVEIDAVMDTNGRLRLTVRELMELLGQVKETKKGKPFIVSGGVVKRAPRHASQQ